MTTYKFSVIGRNEEYKNRPGCSHLITGKIRIDKQDETAVIIADDPKWSQRKVDISPEWYRRFPEYRLVEMLLKDQFFRFYDFVSVSYVRIETKI